MAQPESRLQNQLRQVATSLQALGDQQQSILTAAERDEVIDTLQRDDDFDEEDEDEGYGEGEEEDGEDGLDATFEAVSSIFQAHIVEKTRDAYERAQIKLIHWIYSLANEHPHIIERQHFKALLHEEVTTAFESAN